MVPERPVWVILLNGDNLTDAPAWGLKDTLAAVVAREANGTTVCKKITHENMGSIDFVGDDASVLVINDCEARDYEHECEALLEKLCLNERKVWVHFGEYNSKSSKLTRAEIDTQWKEAWFHERYKALRTGPVNPFSMTSRTKWDRQLQSLAKALQIAFGSEASHTEELRRRIYELGEAWNLADGYYYAMQPFGNWVKIVFPLFLDAMGIELAKNRGADTDKWCAEALESYQKPRKEITSDLGLSGLLARAKEVLKADNSGDDKNLTCLFQDCREVSEILERIRQEDASFPILGDQAQKLLALSVLLRRMEQHFSQ